MSDLLLLPSTRYEPPPTSRDRRRARGLNTIMEEEGDSSRGPVQQTVQRKGSWEKKQDETTPRVDHFRNRTNDLRVQAWLSPQSDAFPTPKGFPTPRGTHFLEVPTLPSSPSSYSADDDEELSGSESTSSNPWNTRSGGGSRSSVMTDSTEFDDMYDTSEDEARRERPMPVSRASSLQRQSAIRSKSTSTARPRQALPPLRIPAEATQQDEIDIKKISSPIAPTPTLTVTMDATVMEELMARTDQDPPTAPPSLDGSLTSEQMAHMSAPPTPMLGSVNGDGNIDQDWSGVHLQPGALATLHALSGENSEDELAHEQPDQVIEVPQEPAREMQQHQGLRLVTNFAPSRGTGSAVVSPLGARASFASLTRLDIPSPGGFFSELSPRSRRTWDTFRPLTDDDIAPPTSTTAEQFYRAPWNADEAPAMPLPPPPPRRSGPPQQKQKQQQPSFQREASSSVPVEHIVNFQPPADEADPPTARRIAPAPPTESDISGTLVEQIVEVQSTITEEGDLPTARRNLSPRAQMFPSTTSAVETSNSTAVEEATEIVRDCDPECARKQQEVALSNLDRTELWLMAQNNYLKGIVNTASPMSPDNEAGPMVPPKDDIPPVPAIEKKEPEAEAALPKKKTVRFSEMVIKSDNPSIPCRLPSKLLRHESAYYRAFQNYIIRTQRSDVFVHRLPRFEALQAQRVSLPEFHRNQLLGKYQLSVVPQSAKKRLSANVARGDDTILDDPEKLRIEKEAEAMSQMAMSTWHVAGMRLLTGGRLLCAPAAKHIGRLSTGLSRRDRPRILDLGGQAVCDWAWHVALQYPNAKVYTATTKAIRQMSNCNVRGPPNHRQIAVERLTRLPFPDEHFDLVSARELHSILKWNTQNGEDEWETCLQECMRVLKPGGYIEFAVMDSDIMKAGPLGLAKSVEFGFTLKRLGYHPEPSKLFLGRLKRAGFQNARRAWVCLPMGARPASSASQKQPANLRPSPDGSEVRTHNLDAMVMGSADDMAPVCGLVGSWSWERWLLRCEMEKVSSELRLVDTVTAGPTMREAGKCLEGVHAIVEEGRRCGAGWRMLTGYARKKSAETEVIRIQLA